LMVGTQRNWCVENRSRILALLQTAASTRWSCKQLSSSVCFDHHALDNLRLCFLWIVEGNTSKYPSCHRVEVVAARHERQLCGVVTIDNGE